MRRLAPALVAAALALAACGGTGGAPAGGADLSGASFTVGSKEFTENVVLGEITVQALEAAGADVAPLATITGTTNVRTALTSGQLDMYWEYTGTGWSAHLQREVSEAPRDPAELYEVVRRDDAANGVAWLDAAPLNNAYAVALPRERQEQLGVRTLSEFAALVASDPAQARLCAAAEFLTRDDGLPGLQRAYGFELAPAAISELELSLIPGEVVRGEACTFGEVFVTDGAVAANDLVLLEDDRAAITPFNAALTVRQEVLDANPRLAEVFAPITAALTSDVMRGLNERVDVGGELPDEVAEQWLAENGFAG
ncbi:glycine betaine ABC transporter substrate-binding protein [Pseudonocardia hydrocarbonoxydans]|uniref:Glycine/betaine ABC transporter substrate-binding protein n=1 Tax=Pseudonocardia hydrocarbonoxydans TaxID=76726 RepID=A0A4Y3WTJ1_9PSEU|nr:glycine betaine ABC transporter substrate-binding protein [Pseudonocardia hydrocarbonoxydans]GEC22084.1 glycine/betaine ABC transporter substrate-binding protein [Pseudonocardia hydrocarbonoxydans]